MQKLRDFFHPALLTLIICLRIGSLSAQTISPRIFSQNAWMPDTIGNVAACNQPPCILYGQLHNKWSKIGESGAQMVRFGGISADRNKPTNFQCIKMIDSIRAKGMEPIIQVPFHNWLYSASEAAAIVQYINVTKGRNIKYWVIGNEPDLEYGYTTANQVASYIKPFASAMKNVDPSIKIIGPETAWYNQGIIDGLTTAGGADDITGTDANGRYYIDIISFHAYPFDGSQTRSAMISKLNSAGGLQANLTALNSRVNSCNSAHARTGTNGLKTAVTEANVNWQNATTDNLNGTGVNSFIGAQFISEMFGVGMKNGVDIMNIWSVVEGNSTALNIGYIDGATGNKKPAFHHFQMISQNFNGNYISSASTQTNVKVFASQNSSVTTLMIMNQDLTNDYSTSIRLNSAAITSTSALNINVNANIALQHENMMIPNQSTIIYQFNNQGAKIKKITYTLSNHAASNLPPVITTYTTAPAPIASIAAPVNNTPSQNLTVCSGNTTTLTATAGTNTVEWYSSSTSTNALATGTTFVTPALSANGSTLTVVYYAQAKNSSTVSTRTSISILVNALPVVTVNSGAICSGSSFTMVPNGAVSYTFSNGSSIVSPLSTTFYTVTGANSAGCISKAVSQVTVNSIPVITVNNGSVCPGMVFTMNPSGAASYTFSNGSSTVSPQTSSSYSITGKSAAGCISQSATVAQVLVMQAPVISVNSGSICSGSSFTIVPSGAISYTVLNSGFVVSPSNTTSYQVNGTGSNGCVSAAALSTVNVQHSAIAVNSGTICKGQSFTMIPSGALSYSYSSGSPVVTPFSTTSYTVTGYSGNCSSKAVSYVTVKTTKKGCTATDLARGSAVLPTKKGDSLVDNSSTQYISIGAETLKTPILKNTITDINIAEVNPTLVVYPNPGNGEFTIDTDKEGALTLTDISGNVIFESVISAGTNHVNISDRNPGIYIVKIIRGDKIQFSRIIKQ